MMLAPRTVGRIIAGTARDVHPPLYYLSLHYWIKLFGTSEFAARSLSAGFTLVTVVVMYMLVKRLFSRSAASLAALFLALGPFLVRYGQEARMYAMVAFLMSLATLFLVYATTTTKKYWYYLYGLTIAAALYTHYYTIFVILAHWLYVFYLQFSGGKVKPLKDWHWWGGNALALALFLPWLPTAYHQFTRVQAAFWIPPVNVHTLPATFNEFVTFTAPAWLNVTRLILVVAFLAWIAGLIWRRPDKRSGLVLLTLYMITGPLAVFALSLRRPIYVDRYFVFAAVAFYALLGVLIAIGLPDGWAKFRGLLAALLIILFGWGVKNVYSQADHQMRQVATTVNSHFAAGDVVISGEIYTYFDFSYYNRTGQVAKLLAPTGVSGYNESGLIYDQPGVVVKSYSNLRPSSNRVWVVGKTGDHDYFIKIPANWTAIGPHYQSGYVAAQEYLIK